MIFRWIRFLRGLGQSLTVRAAIFCAGAIAVALLAVVFSPYVPDEVAELLGSDAVDRILTILASSMLVVVTFSLSTLIASYSAAASSAPARATAIIIQDSNAQNALSTFLGAFIFSIVSIVALSTEYYGAKGRVILFGVIVMVLAAVIFTVIRWIGQLSSIGRLGNVIQQIENTSRQAIKKQAHLFLSDSRTKKPPQDAHTITCTTTGFMQTIDIKVLTDLADEHRSEIWIEVYAGQFVYPGLTLAKISGPLEQSDDCLKAVQASFFIDKRRTFEDDPRFGFVVLSEIASRALSPAINDPGTAIEIIGSLLRLVTEIQAVLSEKQINPLPQNVHLRPVTPHEIVDDAYQALARDGAGLVEVGIFLQKALGAIYDLPDFKDAAYSCSTRSLERSKEKLDVKDYERLLRAAAWREHSV